MEAGEWLKAELLKLGCEDGLANSICFATGQRQAMQDAGEDPYEPCKSALLRYANGDWDVPGEELADRLINEKFDFPDEKGKFLEFLIKKLKEK